jgi:Zn-dependent protease with chaperone function
MGHEVAHADLGHCIERLQYRLQAQRLDPVLLPEIVDLGEALWNAAFDDEQEAEADRRGVAYAAQAGYHPEGGASALRRLEALYGTPAPPPDRLDREVAGMLRGALDAYFRTHPPTRERIARLAAAAHEQGYDRSRTRYYVGRENHARSLPRAQQELPGEFVTGGLEDSARRGG